MTAEQQTKLNEYRSKFDNAKSIYEKELQENTYGWAQHNSATADKAWGFVIPGQTTNASSVMFGEWLQASNASLIVKKQVMDSANADLNNYLMQLDRETQNEFAQTNPQLYADLVKNSQEQEQKLFAAKSTWYILGGVILICVVIAGIIIYKRYKK